MTSPRVIPMFCRRWLHAAVLSLTATVQAQFTWSTGSIPQTNFSSGQTLTISGANDHDYNATTINNAGTIDWNGGRLRSGNAGGIVNAAGGVFNDSASAAINNDLGGTIASFTNNGSYRKLGGGTTSITVLFDNNSSVLVASGNLLLAGGGTASGSSQFNVDPGGTLTFGGGTYTLSHGASLIGSGDITLTAGTLSAATGTATLSNLAMSGGSLGGTGTASIGGLVQTGGSTGVASLTLTGVSSWSGGNWNGGAGSTATITAGGILTLSSANDHDFSARTITNNGIVNWTGGRLRAGNAGGIVNSATWNDSASSAVNNDMGGTLATFTNAVGGTYNKTATGTTTFTIPFNNNAAVNVTGGTLSLSNGGTAAAAATFAVGAEGALNFGGGTYSLASGASLSGAGTFSVTAGTLSVSSGTASMSNLTVNGGTLGGVGHAAVGSLTVSSGSVGIASLAFGGTSTWSGGNWHGSAGAAATINSGGSLTISSGNDHDFSARTITNNGIVNWTGGRLRAGNAGGIVNNATWNDSASSAVNNDMGGTLATFTNAAGGTYNKTATGTTTFTIPFNNNAAVNVTGGTLSLSNGGTAAAAATFAVGAEGALNFGGGTYSLASDASLSGAGTFSVTAGTLSVSSGTASLSNLTVNGGTLGGVGHAAVGSLTVSSGSVGIASLAFGGTSTWSGGNWHGSAGATATINSGGSLTISSGNDHDFSARTITNNGIVNWTGGRLRAGNAGGIVNNATWNDSASSAVNNDMGGTLATFTNAAGGTYNKTATGTTTFTIPFNNNAAVNVTGGTLSLSNGGSAAAAATFAVGASGGLNFGGGTYSLASGASLSGAGLFSVSAGSLAVAAGSAEISNLTVNGGSLGGAGHAAIGALTVTSGGVGIASLGVGGVSGWSGGNWNGPASSTATVGATGTLTISSGNDHDFSARTLTNNGIVNWTGGRLRSGNGGGIVNNATWNDAASSVMNNDMGGASSAFTNASGGTYNKTAANTTRFDVPFTNHGAIHVTGGTLQFANGGSSDGTFTTGATGSVLFSNSYSIADGSSLLGAGGYQVSGGTFTVNGNVNVANFQFSGGTLAGTHAFTGALTWNGGALNSAGTTTIGASGALTVAGNFDHDFSQRTITNHGTVNWSAGAGRLRSGNSGGITNHGTFNDAASNVMNNDMGGTTSLFHNATTGIYNKSAAGTTRFDVPFNNDGRINVTAGTLQFANGGTNSATGELNASADANVVFSNSYTLADASRLSGAGSFAVTGGTFTINGTANVSSFSVSGGLLAGTHAFNGAVTWNGGTLNSAGTTTIGPTSTFTVSGNFDHDFNGRAWVNNGTVNWAAGAGRLRSGNSGVFTNHATFNDAASNVMNNDYGGTTFVFNNATGGTYNKTAAGTTRFDVPFNNDGTVAITAGTLQLNGGGTNSASGVLNAGAGTSVLFSNSYTLANASQLTGAGSFALTGGTLAINGTATVSSFAVSGGLLTGTHTFNGATTWNGGSLNSSGTTTVGLGSTFTVSGNFDHDFNGRSIVNHGTLEWAVGAGRLRSGNAGGITNNGTFNDSASAHINNDYGGTASTFVNASGGTYNKNAGSTLILVPFDNSGIVNVAEGATLDLRGGGTNSTAGAINAASGANVIFSGGYTLANASALAGAGSFSVTGGTLTANGNVNVSNFTFHGGALAGTQTFTGGLSWAGGHFSTAGTTTIAAGSTFTISGNFDHDFNARAIVNNGTTTWAAGAGRLRSGNASTFTNNGLFIDNASNHVNNDYGGTALVFTNSSGATYRKTGAGQTSLLTTFVNAGTLDVQTGVLALHSGGTLSNGGSMIGAGVFQLLGGTLTATGTTSFSNFDIAGGMVAGTHTFDGQVKWTAGHFNNNGSTSIAGTFDVVGGSDHDFNTHAFTNNGTVNWSGGRIRSGNGGVFTNQGTFNDTANMAFNSEYGGTAAQFANNATGIYNKNGSGTTSFLGVSFINAGTVNANAGTLDLGGGGSSSVGARFNATEGAALRFTGGSFAIADGSSFAGNGTFAIAGATVNLGTTINVPDFQLTSGTLTGTQTFAGGLRWTGGSMNASGTTTIGAGGTLTISGGVDHDFNTHALVNNGTVDWLGGRLRGGNAATITNHGTWNDAAGSSINNDYGGTVLVFTNAAGGFYRKNGGTTSTVLVPFTNHGQIETTIGSLVLTAGGAIGNGASYVGAGQTLLTGGTFTATGTIASTNLLLAGAQLAGSHTFTGVLGWDSGHFNNNGTTTIAPASTLRIATAADHDFNTHAFVNNGTVNWIGGRLRSGNGGSIANFGTWNDTASSTINNDYGGTQATFANSGVYLKGAAGTTFIDIPFTNSGTINVTAGTLNIRGSFTNNNGGVLLANGAVAQFPAALALGTGALVGSGTVNASSVTAGGFVSPGTTTGTLAITGNLTLLGTSSLLIELGGTGQGTTYDFLSVGGTALVGGNLSLHFTNNFHATVQPGDSFTILSGTSLSGAFANAPVNGRYTFNGFGSFDLTYTGTSLLLSNIAAVPEPSTWAMLLSGVLLVAWQLRRRR